MDLRVLDRFNESADQSKTVASKDKKASPSHSRGEKVRNSERENLSAAEIRRRVEAHEKSLVEVNSKKAQQKEKIEKHSSEEELEPGVKSDIAENNPKSEETQEKLRHVLRTNSFNFSDRERAALNEILTKE